jgi:hypothetical protein
MFFQFFSTQGGLAPPGAFSISSTSPYVEQNTVTWGSSTGASTYTLKRGTSPGVYGTTVSSSATSPYVDTGLTAGTKYYYRVDAVNVGGTTTSSNEGSGLPPIYRSLLFNGTTQYLSASTNAGLNPDYNTAFWISFWIKSSQAGQPTILSNLDSGGKGLYVLLDGGKMEVHLYDALEAHATSVKTATSVNDGLWHHIAIVKTTSPAASAWTIYIDGVSDSLNTVTDTLVNTSTTTTATCTIGADLLGAGGSAQDFFSGTLNQFAFKMNATLTAGNVTTIYNSGVPTDITSFAPSVWLYLFGGSDALSASGLIDRGTSSMNFSPNGSMSVGSNVFNNVRLAVGRSFILNGTDTMMKAGAETALNYSKTQKLGFAIWQYVAAGNLGKASHFCREALISPYKGWDHFTLSTSQSMYQTNTWNTSVNLVASSVAISTNQWVLLVCYCDGTGTNAGTHFWTIPQGTTSISEDGKGAGTDTLVGDITNAGTQYTMGNVELDSGNDFMKGRYSQAAIIEGQTIDSTWVSNYLVNKGYPRDMSLAPGVAHLWRYDDTAGDSVSTIVDAIGGITLTVQGTGAFNADSPTWFR